MYTLLFKSFFRTKIFLFSLILLLLLGTVSIFIGKQYLIKQQANIEAAQEFQIESIKQNVAYHGDDLGLLLYYLRFTLMKEPANINAISIGQSDVNPALQAVTIRGLEGQKYDTDFENPSLLMSGNLDLGFVIIYLFPLVIIAMNFNIYSEEKELGTWGILAAQTSSKIKFLTQKLMVRTIFVLAIFTFLIVMAGFTLQIPLGAPLLAIYIQGFLYLLFWVVLSFFVVSFLKNSSLNALILISTWVVLTILVPAIVNNYIINAYQLPEALDAMVEQRDGYHEKWDLEKDATMTGFLEAYPQYASYEVPQDEFSWIWYYGMQHMGDLTAKNTSEEMRQKLLLRNKVSSNIALFVPTIHTQLSFNKIAGTDMMSHLKFLDGLTTFHEELRLGFYKKVFDKETANAVQWDNYEAKFYESKNHINWSLLLLPTIIITLIILIITLFNLKNLQ